MNKLSAIGYARLAPGQSLTETMAVHHTIVYMLKGEAVTITTEGEGAFTAYLTYPHWAEAHE